MSAQLAAQGDHAPPILLTQGFRPFFLAAALRSAIALALWIALFATGMSLPSRFDPLTWHIHEMFFGFAMATVAGFLLTAIPNWTQRRSVSGATLALLVGLWLLGRLACLCSALAPPWVAVVADLSFPVMLIGVITHEIVGARSWRNLPMIAPVTVLAIANLLMHLQAVGARVPTGLGWRLGLGAVLVLISVVAGRIIPAFTRNWLAQSHNATLPAGHALIDRLALGFLHAGVLGWAFLPGNRLVGGVLLLAAVLNAWRLLRWRGVATAAEPLLLVLHVGYGWLVLGSALLGLSVLDADVPQSAAIHGLTAGAIGTMTLAVMTRATRGHTGRALTADGPTRWIYVLVTLAAITRVTAAFGGGWMLRLVVLSACFWLAAFGGFVLHYGPMLLGPRAVR